VIEEYHIKSRLQITASKLKIPNDKFNIIGIHAWPEIFKKIEAEFIIRKNSNTRFNWWWETLKNDNVSVQFANNNAREYLHTIVDKNEKVWFVACDADRDPSKFWLFEGFIEPIQQIIGELHAFEYYVVSKKYEWFLAENHHGYLIGLGTVKSKLLALRESLG